MDKTPSFIAFAREDNKSYIGDMIGNLQAEGFVVMVDAVHGNDPSWFSSSFICPHLFFLMDTGRTLSFFMSETHTPPDLAIYFNQNVEIEDEEWDKIKSWVGAKINPGTESAPLDFEISEVLCKPCNVSPDEFELLTEEDSVWTMPEKTQFEFRCEPWNDVMIYEVWHPFVNAPYTTITREFSKEGHFPFFTSLFFDTTFRINWSDRMFLLHAWKMLDMKGEMNLEILDELYLGRVAACHAGAPEPEVWRVDLETVRGYLEGKYENKPIILKSGSFGFNSKVPKVHAGPINPDEIEEYKRRFPVKDDSKPLTKYI